MSPSPFPPGSHEVRARVYLYLRVSREEQAIGGWSLEAQEARARKWAEAYPGLQIVDTVVDPGVSGKDLERDGVRRVLGDMDSGAVDGVLVVNLLRLTRSSADWSWLMGRYFGPHVKRKEQRQLFSVEDHVDTRTPIGRFVLTVRIAAAQLEREETGERTKRVLRHVQSKGVHLGRVPFGWRRRYCAAADEDNHRCAVCGTLEAVAEEQAIIAGMRSRRAEGATLGAIAGELAAAGVRGRMGGAWSKMSVRRVLGEDGRAAVAG